MNFHVLTLFPEMIENGMNTSITGRAITKGLLTLEAVNIRDYAFNKHQKVDDYPYGGGAGMLMQAQPVYDAYRVVAGDRKVRCVYLTPQGAPFTQKKARELSGEEELVLLCGHYEGIDESSGRGRDGLYFYRRLCPHRWGTGSHGRGGRGGQTGARGTQ
mgnify:CR=1 FL=1